MIKTFKTKKLLLVVFFLSFPHITASQTQFDHSWTGNVESQLRVFLSSGLAGEDGSNGQAIINQMNAMGGIYSGGEFQPHHNGPTGLPTYGFGWFYVSYVPFDPAAYLAGTKQTSANSYYQIIEFGSPPTGNTATPPAVPQPQPTLDLSSLARYDQSERIFANLTAQIVALDVKITDIQNEVHNPSWIKKLITNPVFAPAITAITTYFVCKQSGKC